jgi:ParB-like chromosome segregation protein Spo0J
VNSYEDHPIAAAFPLLEERELRDLADDIRKHGLREAVIIFEGKILDGRNRYRACGNAGIEARIEDFNGDDPVGFVISKNLRRRHLTTSQRAIAAAKLATVTWGGKRWTKCSYEHLPDGGEFSRAHAAAGVGVSYSSASRGHHILKNGVPELIDAVERGKLTVAQAALIAERPKKEQAEHVKNRTAPKRPLKEPKEPLASPSSPLDPKAWLRASAEEKTAFVAEIGFEEFWLAADPAVRRAWIAKRRQMGGFG